MTTPLRLALILASGVGLASCLGGAQTIPYPGQASAAPPEPEPDEELAPGERAAAALLDYCPPVEVKVGAQAYQIYERGGEGEASRLRYQATFSNFPRNCADQAGVLTIHLGVAGFLISGPRGGPGTATVPIRVQVFQDNDVLVLDRPLPTQITVAAGAVRGEFARVEDLVVPSPPRENMRIVLSFDQPR